MTTPACSVRGLGMAYGTTPVLSNVSLEVPRGVVYGVLGPNGAGKSTLLKAMLGLVPSLSGQVEFFGRRLPQVRARVGFMPQSATVDWDFPTTVRDVVTMGTYGSLGWLRRPGLRERELTAAALEQCGISELAERQIGELSGGQRQRVFLSRTLVAGPDLFLMDEPFAGVDARSQQAIVGVLHELRSAGRTVVIVHHDLATVRAYCDEVALLNGTVVASGPVSDAFTPENVRRAYDVASPDDPFLDVAT